MSKMKNSSNKVLNFLILGETGVGKSTWINGFANYLSFQTLDDAERSEIIALIPTTFTMTDENYDEKLISTGDDSNEKHHPGASSTQQPTTHVFTVGDTTINLIDTPGIGDTRGIEQDKKNWKNIMDHLSNYEELHAICILLKPNNARLTVMFQFCVKELLKNLHKDACKNILFCFTNCRSTFYRPGDTMPALTRLLQENRQIGIELQKSTVYCFDSEAVRYLAAVKNGVQFDDKERNEFAISWEKSVEETERLVKYVKSLEPYYVEGTLSVNTARRMAENMAYVLADTSADIQKKVADFESSQPTETFCIKCNKSCCSPCNCMENCVNLEPFNYKKLCNGQYAWAFARNGTSSGIARVILVALLFFFGICIGFRFYSQSEFNNLTVKINDCDKIFIELKKNCTHFSMQAESCKVELKVSCDDLIHQNITCNERADVQKEKCNVLIADQLGWKEMRDCSFYLSVTSLVLWFVVFVCFGWYHSGRRCCSCGCSVTAHGKRPMISSRYKGSEKYRQEQSHLLSEDDEINELNEEQKMIIHASACFAVFLKENSITAFYDNFEDKLQQIIQEVQYRSNGQTLARIQNVLVSYRKEKVLVDVGANQLTPVKIDELAQGLYRLPRMGQRIRYSMGETAAGAKKKMLVKVAKIIQKGLRSLFFDLFISLLFWSNATFHSMTFI